MSGNNNNNNNNDDNNDDELRKTNLKLQRQMMIGLPINDAISTFLNKLLSASGQNAVAIDNKIEQAMDLVKSHLMIAVREEVEVLKERISELLDKIANLELESSIMKSKMSQETLQQVQLEYQAARNNATTAPPATAAIAGAPTTPAIQAAPAPTSTPTQAQAQAQTVITAAAAAAATTNGNGNGNGNNTTAATATATQSAGIIVTGTTTPATTTTTGDNNINAAALTDVTIAGTATTQQQQQQQQQESAANVGDISNINGQNS